MGIIQLASLAWYYCTSTLHCGTSARYNSEEHVNYTEKKEIIYMIWPAIVIDHKEKCGHYSQVPWDFF